MTHVQVASICRLNLRSLQSIDGANHQRCIKKESNQAIEGKQLRQTTDSHEVIWPRDHLVHADVESKKDHCLGNHNDDAKEHAPAWCLPWEQALQGEHVDHWNGFEEIVSDKNAYEVHAAVNNCLDISAHPLTILQNLTIPVDLEGSLGESEKHNGPEDDILEPARLFSSKLAGAIVR